MASRGYHASSSRGDVITGLEKAWGVYGVDVFHAGTSRGGDGRLLTAGGRVLTVTGLGDTFAEARAKAWPDTVQFVHSPIEAIADAGVSGPFDGILAAYLLRNLPEKAKAWEDLLFARRLMAQGKEEKLF